MCNTLIFTNKDSINSINKDTEVIHINLANSSGNIKDNFYKYVSNYENRQIIEKTFKHKNDILKKILIKDDFQFKKSIYNFLDFKINYFLTFNFYVDKALENILSKYQPLNVIFDFNLSKNNIFENSFQTILKKQLKNKKIPFKEKLYLIKEKKRANYFKKIKFLIHKFINIFKKKNNYILFNSDSYNIRFIFNKIKKTNSKVNFCFLEQENIFRLNSIFDIRVSSIVFKKNLENNLNICEISNEFIETSIIDTNLKNYLNYLNRGELNELVNKIYLLNNNLIKNKTKWIICTMSLALSFFLSEFGKINNIETILTPHGTHPYTSDDTINNLWLHSSKFLLSKNFDCIAVQSPIMLNFLKRNSYNEKRLIISGPSNFTHPIKVKSSKGSNVIKKKLNIFSNKKILLHASTPKHYYNLRPIIFENIEEYIFQIKKIDDFITKENLNFHLIIKFREIYGLNFDTFKKKLGNLNNSSISIKEDLEDLFNLSDIIISYSSTVIEEAFTFKKPIILIDYFKRYSHLNYYQNINKDKNILPFKYICNNKDFLEYLNNFNINNFKDEIHWDKFIFESKNIDKLVNKINNKFV